MAFDPDNLAAARPDLVTNWDRAQPGSDYRSANPDDPNIDGILAYGSLDNYLRATWDALGQPDALPPASTGGGNNPTSIGQFGGAAQGGNVTGGAVTAPLASGDDSTAVQTGQGGNVVGGGVEAPIFSAPISAPVTTAGRDVNGPVIESPVGQGSVVVGGDAAGPFITAPLSGSIAAGRDADVSGSVISQNSGTVNITNSDKDVVTAALSSSQSALDSSLNYADKALAAVTDANKPADERVTTSALTAVTIIVVALGAIALYRGRKAA